MSSSVLVDNDQTDSLVLTPTDSSDTPAQVSVLLPSPLSDQQATDIDISGEPPEDFTNASYYWDAATMAPLNATSAAAISRLRAYKPPPFPLWDRLPVSRRAAVLMLLYADRKGDLRVVITMRAASLRSFSGHAALPGGKADTPEETPYQIARREAWEEIGLPMDDSQIPAPFTIEPLCNLPFSLARTELVVRTCIALLHSPSTSSSETPTVEDSLIPRLDAKEVAAVFSAPFHNFLRRTDETSSPPPGKWYEGNWTQWNDHPWRLHFFYVPVTEQHVSKPKLSTEQEAALADELEVDEHPGRYKVWGMTARMLVDTARIAYGEEPEFEHNAHFGDEDMIVELDRLGRLTPKKRKRDDKM